MSHAKWIIMTPNHLFTWAVTATAAYSLLTGQQGEQTFRRTGRFGKFLNLRALFSSLCQTMLLHFSDLGKLTNRRPKLLNDNKPELAFNLFLDSRPPSSSQSVSITQQRRSEVEKKPRWVWSTALQRATTAHWINMSSSLAINSLS